MKQKLLNLGVIVTSLMGYLAWGKDNNMFLFQMEAEIVEKLSSSPGSVLHPLIVLPLFGQLLLVITLFQARPGKWLTYAGIACLGLLLGFMFIIGIIGFQYKILLSTLPFLIVAFFAMRNLRNEKLGTQMTHKS